jgi:hypothetical protein
MILALRNSTECNGGAAHFDAGYGGCATYASENKDYCQSDLDKKTGAVAAEVCPECGTCTESKTPTPSPSPTPGGASCKAAPGDKKYGPHCPTRTSQEDCETMKPHCQWVKDGEQFIKMSCRAAPGDKKYEFVCKKQDWEEGCTKHAPHCQWLAEGEEFEKPTGPPKPTTCKGSYADFDAGWGGCETYASASNGNKAYCDSDADEETGTVAAEVCPECGKCTGANGGGKSPGKGGSCKAAPDDKKYGPHCPKRKAAKSCKKLAPHCQWVMDGEQFTKMSCRAAPGDTKYELVCKKQDWEKGCAKYAPHCQWLAQGEEFKVPTK